MFRDEMPNNRYLVSAEKTNAFIAEKS